MPWMTTTSSTAIRVRSLEEVDLGDIVRIAERTRKAYQPDLWEDRVSYYLRRDPDSSVVAEVDGEVVGFMLGDVRSGEFGIEEPSGWIEVIGVDPDAAGRGVGRALGEEMLARYRARGVARVRTMVDASMPDVEGFFVSLGFAPDTLRPFVKLFTDRERD
jgi:ribosomal protein S18 acetylase RimI-like enzyme